MKSYQNMANLKIFLPNEQSNYQEISMNVFPKKINDWNIDKTI